MKKETVQTEKAFKNEGAVANRIAKLYLEQHPRTKKYPVRISSSEDDSEVVACYEFSESELAVLRKWQDMSKDERSDYSCLGEYLEEQHCDDLINRLLDGHSPLALDIIEDCDLDSPEMFMACSVRTLNDDGQLNQPYLRNISFTNEEYLELFALLLRNGNNYSVNHLVFTHPELSKKIMKHCCISNMLLAYIDDTPFIVELDEVKNAVKSVLNPFIDVLHLFDSDDKELASFVRFHQVAPSSEILSEEDTDEQMFHVAINK